MYLISAFLHYLELSFLVSYGKSIWLWHCWWIFLSAKRMEHLEEYLLDQDSSVVVVIFGSIDSD